MITFLIILGVAFLVLMFFSKGVTRDFHSWRGFFFWPHEPDLFHFRITAGFVTLWVCKFCVHERFNAVTRLVTGRGE